jgi:hypothetical protein
LSEETRERKSEAAATQARGVAATAFAGGGEHEGRLRGRAAGVLLAVRMCCASMGRGERGEGSGGGVGLRGSAAVPF